MGTHYSLVVPSRKLISDEVQKYSSRHRAVDFTEHGCSFIAAAGRIFFVQEYLRDAGMADTRAITEDFFEGQSPTKGCEVVPLDTMVGRARAEAPSTPVTLVVGEADLHGCTHESPCGPHLVSHRCGWTESSPVDRAVCEVCPHFRGDREAQGAVLKWDAVLCGHPDAYRNLLKES